MNKSSDDPSKNDVRHLSDFVAKIEALKLSSYPFSFFRGEANHAWKPQPSLFRENLKSKIDSRPLFTKESEIINTVLSKSPETFSQDLTLFEKLVRMQHFGVPTRLLDVTFSPLVALYFAVHEQKHDETDGVVYIHKREKPISFSDENIVSARANISLLEYNENNALKETLKEFKDYYDELEKEESSENLSEEPRIYIPGQSFDPDNGEYAPIHQPYGREGLDSLFNQQNILCKLRKLIKEDMNSDIFIKIPYISRGIAVRPKLKNKRIIAQQGLFILFGINKEINANFRHKIFIKKEFKETLRKDLNQMGINDMTMFPDFQGMAERIKNNI